MDVSPGVGGVGEGRGRGLPVRTGGFLELLTARPSHLVPLEAISSSACTQGQSPQSTGDRSGLTPPPLHTDQSGVSSQSVRFIFLKTKPACLWQRTLE